ncbi:hypothetical protein ACFQ6V_09510 [Streptomyces roseifaciens]
MGFIRRVPRAGEGAAALAVVLVAALGFAALGLVPGRDRPLIGGVLLGAAAALVAIAALLVHVRHRAAVPHASPLPPGDVDGSWFTPETLEGFPMEVVRPLLAAQDAPSLNCAYVAWICATHGCDAAWIVHNLRLSEEVAHVLVDAAARRRKADPVTTRPSGRPSAPAGR